MTPTPNRKHVSAAVIYALVVTAILVGLVLYTNALHHAALKSCKQQNVARKAANSSASSLNTALTFIAKASHKRSVGVDRNQPIKRAADIKGEVFYRGLANAQKVVPLVDCGSVNHQPWPLG